MQRAFMISILILNSDVTTFVVTWLSCYAFHFLIDLLRVKAFHA